MSVGVGVGGGGYVWMYGKTFVSLNIYHYKRKKENT